MNTMAAPVSRASAYGFAALGLGALIIAICGAARLSGFAAPPAPAPVIASALLNFADAPSGAVTITDATTGRVIDTVPPRGGGFLRSTMRVMATERTDNNIGRAAPFSLTALAGNRIQLTDTATGQTLELEAFGPSNAAEFAALLQLAETQK